MSLSDIQRRVASLILAIPEASEFALAGGAALILYEVSDRGTSDLDCFGPSVEAVDRLVPAAVTILNSAGFDIHVELQRNGFARLRIGFDSAETLLDLGYDPADLPPMVTSVGAVRALPDLAGDKLLALFGRAAPRDFVDVVALLDRFTRSELFELAAAKDRGFDGHVLADAFGVLPTIRRDRFDLDDASYDRMRSVFASWRVDLESSEESP